MDSRLCLGIMLKRRKEKKRKKTSVGLIDQRIINLAKEKGISIEEAARILRRAHILLEHGKDKIIWVRCVS